MKTILTDEGKFILPYITIFKEGFVNIFSEDQNRPYLDKNYFVVHTAKDAIDLYHMSNHYTKQKGFKKETSYRINDIYYYVYIFELDSTFTHYYELFISNNHKEIPNYIIQHIINYWRSRDTECNIFNNQYNNSYIPHSDYIESLSDILLKQLTNETNTSILDIEYSTEKF